MIEDLFDRSSWGVLLADRATDQDALTVLGVCLVAGGLVLAWVMIRRRR